MSKRGDGTRNGGALTKARSKPAGGRPPAEGRAPAKPGKDAKRVGARAFTRRANATKPRRSAPGVRTRGGGLSGYAASLPQLTFRDLVELFQRTVRRAPRTAWICALIACLNAVCWSIVTPAFQVPDEPDHFAYVKQLAETGKLPTSSSEQISSEELTVLRALHNFQVRQQPQDRTISSRAEQRELQRALAANSGSAQAGSPAAGVAASQPPLYYILEAIPYSVAGGSTMLNRLQLMRLVSALFAGITAMMAFLFVREALPGAPWAWVVGGLGVALAPLLGFMSGAVNPDSLLFAVSAAIFYCMARAFRRGLSVSVALSIGALTAAGFLTKVNFVGLAPGVLLGLVLLAKREARTTGRSAYRLLGASAGLALCPVILFAAVNAVTGDSLLGIASKAIDSAHGSHGSILAQINYIWQLYLPHIPGTVNDFPGIFTTRQLWFNGFVGLYGWIDTPFPGWVNSLALIPAGAIALLCGRSLVQGRSALRARASELVVYAVMGIGLAVLVGADSYLAFPATDAEYAQARYLLPLLALFAAIPVLAARGAGRRWGPVVGAALVVLFLGHDIFSQLQVISRYYG